MDRIKAFIRYFTFTEKIIFISSFILITGSFIMFGGSGYLSFIASVIGLCSLIFVAKGNPVGQFLAIIFAIFYSIISYSFSYYGEMITYMGMTAPMALFSLIAWIKNPFNGKKSEVKVHALSRTDIGIGIALTVIVTIIFYYMLKHFHTANLIPSTISVTTSFLAVYLTFRRSPYYAIAYSANDIILIILWVLASTSDISYASVVICFVVFLINDIYGYINWKRLQKKQNIKNVSRET